MGSITFKGTTANIEKKKEKEKSQKIKWYHQGVQKNNNNSIQWGKSNAS